MKNKGFIIFIMVIFVVFGAILFFLIRNNANRSNNKNNVVDNNEIYYQVLENGTKLNTSSKLLENKEVNGLKVTNVQLAEQGNLTTILADVENNTGNDINEPMEVNLVLLNKNGNEIGTIPGIISPVKNKGRVQLNANCTGDLANAYDLRIEKKY